jgi:aminoglycoside phosphotransferase (APT) family kinase protein
MAVEARVSRPGGSAHPNTNLPESLTEFLRGELFPSAAAVRVVDESRPSVGGSWETFFLTLEADGRASGHDRRRVVIKRAPDDGPMAPYRADKDALILAALEGTDVPHPRLLAWTDDREVFERPFTVTEFVDGELEDLARIERWPPWQQHREELGYEIVDTLVSLQRFDWRPSGVASVLSWDGLGGSTDHRMAATVGKWLHSYAAYHNGDSVVSGPGPVVWQEVGAWLIDNVAVLGEPELVVVHGDYRFGNLIWSGKRIAAIIDWERATLGDPMSDLGFICMPYSRLRDPTLMAKALTYEQLVARYEKISGHPVDHRRLQYYSIFWEFIEGSQGCQPAAKLSQTGRTGGTLAAMRRELVSSTHLLTPNFSIRHALGMIERYEAGDHRVL